MKLLNTSLLLVLFCRIWIGKALFWEDDPTTTTESRENYIKTMKYGWQLFQKFKYGNQPKAGDYPAVAKVRRLEKGIFHFCGGTLIDLSHVLTSYWCLYRPNRLQIVRRPGQVTVTAGTIFSYDYLGYFYDPETESYRSDAEGSQMRFVKYEITPNGTKVIQTSRQWWKYESFTFKYDLLLLVTDKPFFGTRFVKRVDIWTFEIKEANKSLEYLAHPSRGLHCKVLSFGYETYEPVLTYVVVKPVQERPCIRFACWSNEMDYIYSQALCFYKLRQNTKICAIHELSIDNPFDGVLQLSQGDRFGTTGDAMYCSGTYLFGVTSFKFQKSHAETDEELGYLYYPFVLTGIPDIITFLDEVQIRVRSNANLVVTSLLLPVMSSALTMKQG